MAPLQRQHLRRKVKPAYTARDLDLDLVDADALLLTGDRARAVDAFRVVCLGAGGDSAELAAARGADVRRHAGHVVVDLRGPRSRTVPVVARYANLALDLAGRHPDDTLFPPLAGRNGVAYRLSTLAVHRRTPPLVTARAVSTWRTHHLHRHVPLTVLMAASGVATLAVFADLPPVDPSAIVAMLASADAGGTLSAGVPVPGRGQRP